MQKKFFYVVGNKNCICYLAIKIVFVIIFVDILKVLLVILFDNAYVILRSAWFLNEYFRKNT